MKWLIFAQIATQNLLGSKRCLLGHGSFGQRFFNHASPASNPIGWLDPNQLRYSSLYHGHYYSTLKYRKATESPYDVKKVDLEIISRETIKPSAPTPHHLRNFNLSIIDQFMYDVYVPLIVFFPNTNQASNVTNVVTKRSKHLKESLSKILTRFYPFAGKFKSNMQIECNDEGVYYSEARVNQTLEDFLDLPDDERLRELMPEKPYTKETSIGNYVIGVQVNIFKCGGIGLSTSVSHKIVDGQTFYIFMNAWATTARGSLETISPSFVASEIFPNNPCLQYSVPSKLLATKMLSTKRFVFDSRALTLLKAQHVASVGSVHPPTRMEATIGVIWKAAAQAASKVRPFGPYSPHALLSAVNFRRRMSPPMPQESIGNLVDVAAAICFPCGDMNLPTLIGEVRKSIANINSNHIESMKGEKGHERFNEILRSVTQLTNVTVEGDCVCATSLLNSQLYELDFGWGKPIWFYVMNAGFARLVTLNETLKGGGVEAIVTLSPDEMEIFEHDLELMSYVSINPSPLRFLN
ncbi:hypothetical protein QVD17_16602 [Tagetes erecta]|uniref:Transferase, Chloramphenicol acetyltransferase-like domain protein n=1 Tax=Tagetes erecta TaxID=13708 RepID=A0AAD8KVC1_TARER|nr:hypothetical protein QVD17_16602 [Tagetes erecta]